MTPFDPAVWSGDKPMVAPMPPGDISDIGPGWEVWARIDAEANHEPLGGLCWGVHVGYNDDGEPQRRFYVVTMRGGRPHWLYLAESDVNLEACRPPRDDLVVARIRDVWRYGAGLDNHWGRHHDDVLTTTRRLAEAVVG